MYSPLLMMTTLFNLFCPISTGFSLQVSVFIYVMVGMLVVLSLTLLFYSEGVLTNSLNQDIFLMLFPASGGFSSFLVFMFMALALINLATLTGYSYPVTTTLAFNLSLAFSLWLMSLLILFPKSKSLSSILPSNTPWYLVPFLSLVELVSVLVRPVTLCFRLLANMSAGHILLALICKLPYSSWLFGVLFGVLELMVAVVQSFVFFMLISVYVEESFSH